MNARLKIRNSDLIAEDDQELHNICKAREIRHLVKFWKSNTRPLGCAEGIARVPSRVPAAMPGRKERWLPCRARSRSREAEYRARGAVHGAA
jgi:hypothetical protein